MRHDWQRGPWLTAEERFNLKEKIDRYSKNKEGKKKAATVFERVKEVIKEQLGVEEEEVRPSASLTEDLNADSLDLVELMMALEEKFSKPGQKVEIPDEDARKISTVQDTVDYIKNRGIEDE